MQNNVPLFEENEWKKMEALLDKELPQNKRRILPLFFWIPLFLVGLSSIFFIYNHYHAILIQSKFQNKEASVIEQQYQKNKPNSFLKPTTEPGQMNGKLKLNEAQYGTSNTPAIHKIVPETMKRINRKGIYNIPITNSSHKLNNTQVFTQQKNFIKSDEVLNNTGNSSTTAIVTINAAPKINNHLKVVDEERKSGFVSKNNKIGTDTMKPEPIVEISEFKKQNKNVESKDKQNANSFTENKLSKSVSKISKNNELSLMAISGMQTNGTRLAALGTIEPVYGIGLQYTLGKKWAVRGSIMQQQKNYAARNEDYHAPTGSWASGVVFKNIKADCSVIEIPLSVAFKVKTFKTGSLFVSVGSSTYFMKREQYQFYFKGPSGNDTTRTASFVNNSQHYFSSINLSAIAEKNISSRFSIQAEPFFQLPINGIGVGKIKLYNMGVLLTARLKIK
ncbi:hypothetical protein [Hydrotalea flava]|uniref:hypothetical protein n=1 Tax=Hydrotalea flava TaxID=714549 RepID=UPI00142EF8E5|nr:hypothetical protein [Hydrotalea flava]